MKYVSKTPSQAEILAVHCDGSCMDTIGGIGIVFCTNYTETLLCRGSFKNTTNNRMELLAFIYGFYYLKKIIDFSLKTKKIKVVFYADSKYLVDGHNKWLDNWKKNNWINSNKQEVLNKDLWEEIDNIQSQMEYELFWEKGHCSNEANNKADLLAKMAVLNNNFTATYQIKNNL